jgi:uncharacterized phage protein (TIGR02220 family)
MSPEQKLLFLYLHTSPYSTSCGIFRLQLKTAGFQLGYTNGPVESALHGLCATFPDFVAWDEQTGEVALLQYPKQVLTNASGKTLAIIKRDIEKVQSIPLLRRLISLNSATISKMYLEQIRRLQVVGINSARFDGDMAQSTVNQNDALEREREREREIYIVEFEQLDGTTKMSSNFQINHELEKKTDQITNTDDSGNIVLQVLMYLNVKAGTEYRPGAKSHAQIINAREKEGYTLEDFQKVIDTKVADWLHDAKMRKFLRPSTLFNATHFPEYLNERRIDQAVTQAHEAHDVETPYDESYNKYLSWCKNTYPAIIDHVKHLSKAQFVEFRERKFHKEAKNFQEAFNFKRLDKSHREMAEVASEREKYKDIWTKFLADYDSYMKKITIQ